MSRSTGPGLYEFLMEAELQQYYPGIRGDLKVQNTAQLKYVTEDDLCGIGMTKPEMRRLKKYFQKHFPQNYLSKFKKMLLPRRDEQLPGSLTMLPEERQERPPVRVPNKHMIPADAIIVNKELGTGEFGVVQQGVWTNDGERIQVAIKCLSRERMQNNPIEFLKEAAIMHSIDHEHIVRLYGVVLDTSSLMLVTELAPLRSLLECLKEPSLRTSFPVPSLCDFAVQIADGMQYLEAKRLIHRDLAARNILVFSKHKVKISDFGLSRALGVGKDYYQTNFNVNLKLPIAWCAPECISYLKFTSASDVWAYAVTLWEMFSYGFQPWAALTGHQILEAIDEPNFQRLEQPDCCPKDYFGLMQQCWQHEPIKRPKFAELICLLPDLKPEQVQAVQDNAEIGQLAYRQSDIITVLDKAGPGSALWKGVLNNGKTGLFNPAHTIAYLGGNLPSNKPGEFARGDGKNIFSSQRRKIRTDMISSPQGDLKHTGHVGLDGAYFGDISFLGGKYPHLPRQVVTPYKPQEDATDNSSQFASQDVMMRCSDRDGNSDSPNVQQHLSNNEAQAKHAESLWDDACTTFSQLNSGSVANNMSASMVSSTDSSTLCGDHEYHEISDEDNQESPLRFDKPLSFDFGPSLLDEMDQMFRSLGSSPPPSLPQNHAVPTEHESSNVRNELREIQAKQSSKKKQATVSPINVKPISAADQKTLYSAIAMAQELTARSMTDLEHSQDALHSPRTPASPTRRRKFSFKLPHQHSPKPDRRHFSEEAASIPDIQATLSEEAREVYNSLVETPASGLADAAETNPLRMLRSGLPIVRPRVRGNKHGLGLGLASDDDNFQQHHHHHHHHHHHQLQQQQAQISGRGSSLQQLDEVLQPQQQQQYVSGTRTLPKVRMPGPTYASSGTSTGISSPTTTMQRHRSMEIENNQNQGNVCLEENPIPLPPRDRSKSLQAKSSLPRHQRKHPLIIPGGGISRTLAKMQALSSPTNLPTAVDQVDGYRATLPSEAELSFDSGLDEPTNSIAASSDTATTATSSADSTPAISDAIAKATNFTTGQQRPNNSLQLMTNCREKFKQCVDSDLDFPTTEDARQQQQQQQQTHRCSVISEDLLEFSENLLVGIASNDSSEDDEGVQESIDKESMKKIHEKVEENNTKNVQGANAEQDQQTSTSAASIAVQQQQQPIFKQSASHTNISDVGKNPSEIAGSPLGSIDQPETMTRTSDHVSCEDLLEFACDGPNSRRTRGPRNGEQSDEVRIMLKVLHEQSSPESCVAALNVTNWDVLAAIKLERLQGLLKKENNFVSLEDCKIMLNQCGGDVVKAAALLTSTEDTAAV